MVEEKLSFPERLSDYFDSSRSSLNPYNRGQGSFVYGTVPVVLAKALGKLLGKTGYDGTYLVGRVLSALFDLATVWVVYLLTRRVAPRLGRSAALVAAGLLTFCPLAIQLSHFWTVDTFLTTFCALALLGAVRHAVGRSRPWGDIATGIAIGLAVSCKVTGLGLFLPVGVAILIRALRAEESGSSAGKAAKAAGSFLLVAMVAAFTVRVALPHAFLGPSPLSFRLDARYVEDLRRLAALSASAAGYPPSLQWAGRTILFPLDNFLFWAAGPFFGLAALAGLLWAPAAILREKKWGLAPLFLHATLLIAYHASSLAKTLRYFYPVYPVLAVLAAISLSRLSRRAAVSGPLRGLPRFLPVAALVGTFAWGLAFTAIYWRPHTRVEASRWIYANVPAPARFANESWDDGLPFPLPGYDNGLYAGPTLDLWGPDNPQKVDQIVKTLEGADWIAVTSGRVYANITRLPTVFPMTTAYYRALFDGRLGFERAAEFTSYPSLGPLRIPDDRAEEQFTVYDHPRVLLFRKTPQFSRERTRKILLAAMPETPPTIWDWEKQPRGHRPVGSSLLPPRRADLEKATSSALPSLEIGSWGAATLWYLTLLLLWAVAFPLAYALFPCLRDRGAGIARILGLVLATFFHVLAVQLHLLSNGRGAAAFSLFLVAALSSVILLVRKRLIVGFVREHWRLMLVGEAAFALGYLLFLGIRAFNPEIYWGEKPMDFSILNILVRTRTFPASDPWFAGVPLSYYTFGHQIVAFLTLVTGLSTRYTFNLAFGLLGGLTLQAAFTLARNWAGTRRAGIGAAALTALVGNLAGPREWLVNKRHLDWDYFWATSRVIKDTINEYPLWSFVFADLHAHVLAIPLLIFLLACAVQFVRAQADPEASLGERLRAAALLGASAAFVALTNAWDVPLLAGLLPLIALIAAFGRRTISVASAGRAALGLVIAVATALAVAAPLWVRAGGMPAMGRNATGARGLDILTVFGLFFLLAVGWGLACANAALARAGWSRPLRWIALAALLLLLAGLVLRAVDLFLAAGVLFFLAAAVWRGKSPEQRFALALLAAAFFLVLFPQHFYIYDRMNTFFKLYLEAWLLFALSTAVLVFGPRTETGVIESWPLPGRVALALAALPAFFTAATAVRGALGHHFAAYSGPSLDGLRYLEQSRPGEYRAVVWLWRAVRGTPVTLEAQGDSYKDFGRISMLTGLPTVLGWDYHVKQRGNRDSEIQARKEAIEQIYRNPHAEAVEGLLRRYHVGYVYVGWLERTTYCDKKLPEDPCTGPGTGLAKFDSEKDLFRRVYENAQAKIYRVVAGDTEDVVTPVRESLPAVPAATGPAQDEPEETPAIAASATPGERPYAGMREPRGAAVDGEGRLWVADFGRNRLRVFDPQGGYLGGWGGRGAGTYGLREPCGVAIQGEKLYVADTWNGRIEAFTLAGAWRAQAPGLYGPRGVAVAPDGKVWATDTGNHRLVVYEESLSGARLIGAAGKGPAEFSGPVGIAADPAGRIYVADVGNRRIQVLDTSGRSLAAWPFPGWREWGEAHLESDGRHVFATDPPANSVLVLDSDGRLVATWTTDDGGRPFARPTGVALDEKKRALYVVNSAGDSVSRLDLARRRFP